MSWSGTVRCGYCYNEGHNMRGCPKRKARAAEDIANGHSTHAARIAVAVIALNPVIMPPHALESRVIGHVCQRQTHSGERT